MARILSLFPAALSAAKRDVSANAFVREQVAAGESARRSEMLQLFKIAKAVVARTPDEVFRDQKAVPTGPEITEWPTRHATGIVQTVTLTYRDRTTGQIKQTWWHTTTENGITRERAIAEAIDAYSEHAEDYEQDLIGAVHTSAYRLTPFGS